MPQPSDEPSPSLYDRARDLFDRSWVLPPAERAAFMEREANGDPQLLAAAMSLQAAFGTNPDAQGQGAKQQWLDEQATAQQVANAPGIGPDQVQPTSTTDLLAKLATAPKLDTSRYRLEGRIGSGGMGVVSRIHDQQLNRRLAMKVPLERLVTETNEEQRRSLARFLEEAQVTGQLDHPGVVPVHDLGMDQSGRVYFTMRLVKGGTASEAFSDAHKKTNDWTITRALEIILKVCDTMAYAHDKGVLHRDLKPANVMVGKFGEVYVMDWGLAKLITAAGARDLRPVDDPAVAHEAPLKSLPGQTPGTPNYMAPEQARGETMDVRADVYSIGAMLYELLTGRAPYAMTGKDGDKIRRDVAEGPPKRIEEIEQGVPAELVAIADKAMHRDREQRYASTTALAADLRAFLGSQVVSAYRTGALVELQLWVRRNKPLAASLVAAALILVAGIVGTTAYADRAAKNETLARANEATANRTAEQLAAKVRDFNQLGADVRHRSAIATQENLWPAWPDKIEALESWLRKDCGELLAMEPEIRRTVEDLRAQSLQLTLEQVEADRRSDPKFAEFELLTKQVASLRYAQSIRTGQQQLIMPDLTPEQQAMDARALNALAWQRVSPKAADRALWGEEAQGLATAQAAVDRATTEQLAGTKLTLYWALKANGQDAAAHTLAQKFVARSDNDLLVLDFEGNLTGRRGECPTRHAAIEFTQGVAGQASVFGANSALVYSAQGAIDASEGTFEAWISPGWNGDGGTSHYLLRYGRDGGILLGKDGAGYLRLITNRFGKEQGASFSIASWRPGSWHHICFTWSNSAHTLCIYVDGVVAATTKLFDSLPKIADSELQVGGDGDVSSAMATIDELRLRRLAMTPEEVNLHYLAHEPHGADSGITSDLEQLEADLAALEREVESQRTWSFAASAEGAAARFLHDALTELLDKLALLTKERIGAEQRLRWAREVQAASLAPKAQRRWATAREAIAKADGVVASTRYAGISIPLPSTAVMGLVPIGMNPVTQLWEFYELRSAWDGKQALGEIAIPTHKADGSIEVKDGTGIVFVLLPGGKVLLGSQASDPKAAYYDEMHDRDEMLHPVTLSPYFVARHEMTQGQWSRMMTWDAALRYPSAHNPGLTHPVELVDWSMCNILLTRHGMVLPSEAQWEYACRGGTSTPWTVARAELSKVANVADADAKEFWPNVEAWSDGHVVHAPVGCFGANAFGLYDVQGNVQEWCRDQISRYGSERHGDGLRPDQATGPIFRCNRGGHFHWPAAQARPAFRSADTPLVRLDVLGLRPARLIAH